MSKRYYSPEKIITALAIIFLGVILILKAFNINTKIFFDGWWTLFLIVQGFIKIFRDKKKATGIILFVLGVSLLLAEREIIIWRNFGLVLIGGLFVAFGIRLIFPGKRQRQHHARKRDWYYHSPFNDFEDEYSDDAF